MSQDRCGFESFNAALFEHFWWYLSKASNPMERDEQESPRKRSSEARVRGGWAGERKIPGRG